MQAACASPAAAAAAAAIAAETQALEPHWCMGVYQRVFLTQSAAAAWHGWNGMRGDPAQPFHYQHMVQHVQQQVGLQRSPQRAMHTGVKPSSHSCHSEHAVHGLLVNDVHGQGHASRATSTAAWGCSMDGVARATGAVGDTNRQCS
jgi:hypothetical protein